MRKLMLVISIVAMSMNAGCAFATSVQDSLRYPVTDYNGITYDLRLAYDSTGTPSHYHAHMLTPVCDDNVCKPVYINLYWDLMGNYLRYDVPPKYPLTKMDHEEFGKEEYEKLHGILADSNSLLKEYKTEELVESASNTMPGDVDAVTGATAKSLQAVIIPGALYTCYTLWHITHGRVTDTIAKITDSITTPQLLSHFLASRNHHYQYYALDKVMDSQGNVDRNHEQQVIRLITDPNLFLAIAVLKRLSPAYFADAESQLWLWAAFRDGNYRLKLGILEKLAQLKLADSLRSLLEMQKGEFNEDIAKRIEYLLNKQS